MASRRSSKNLSLRQRRRLLHGSSKNIKELLATSNYKNLEKTAKSGVITNEQTPVKAILPLRPQTLMNNPSPRKANHSFLHISDYNFVQESSRQTELTSCCYGQSKNFPCSPSHTNSSTGEIKSSNDKNFTDLSPIPQTKAAVKSKQRTCKLVYTGSFGVGYTCSVCKVFREWRKVYLCTGELETKGLGRHFAGKSEQKYLEFIDGTSSASLPLPQEILEEILQMLDYRSLCRSEATCTDWYRISHQPKFVDSMVHRDRKQSQFCQKNNGQYDLTSMKQFPNTAKHGMAFVEVVHAAVRQARNACRTNTLEKEIPQRIKMYASKDVKKNQHFRTKLAECSINWIAFLLDELSGLCKDNKYRKQHPAFLAKLKFIEKELCRRRKGRAASSKHGYIEWLEELRRKVQLAVREGRKPRMGEAKIRDLKCNWRK
jgi:hypothetical protein